MRAPHWHARSHLAWGRSLRRRAKYNYRIVRDEYLAMTSIPCDNMHDTNFAYSSLHESGVCPS